MFLRNTRRWKDGKEHQYWSIVENRRCAGGKIVQRPVLYLGEINDSQREAWCRVVEGFDGDSGQLALTALYRWFCGCEDFGAIKKLSELVEDHGRRYRDALDAHWSESDLTRKEAEVILRRMDNVLVQLPEARRQVPPDRNISREAVGSRTPLHRGVSSSSQAPAGDPPPCRGRPENISRSMLCSGKPPKVSVLWIICLAA